MKKIWAADKSFVVDYLTRMENATANEVAVAAQTFGNQPLPDILSLDGSTAKIKIEGVLTRSGPSFLDRFFGYGGTGYNQILESIQAIIDNDEIDNVRLIMDTPGGEVSGVDEVYQALRSLSKKKKVIAENRGLIASAGYWIASTASKIITTSPTSETGSIGVIITAVDYSKMDEKMGIRVVRIVSKNAPNKAPDISKKAGLDVLQDRVDAIEKIFIQRIATGRKKSTTEIINKFGRGGLLIAEDAVKVGMIDKIIGFDINENNKYSEENINEDINNDIFGSENDDSVEILALNNGNTSQAQQGANNITEGQIMTLKEFFEQNPGAAADYTKALDDKFKAGIAEGKETGKNEMKAHIKKCSEFLENDKYKSQSFQNLVKKALNGNVSIDAVEGAAAVLDVNHENTASENAKNEQEGQAETTGQTDSLATGDEEKYQDQVSLDKKALGIK